MIAPLVFLPGWCLGRGPLQGVADALQGQFVDLPGYGDMPWVGDFSSAVDLVAARLSPGTTLAGWSLGAQLALAVAARVPDKVGRLLLVAGTASFIQRDGWPHGLPAQTLADFSAAISIDAEAMLPRFVGGFNRGDARAKAVTAELLQRADPRPSAGVLSTGLDWLRDVDLRDEAACVRVPTLLIHGAADPLMPLSGAQALADCIPGSRLAVIEDCAHAPFVSRPDVFVSVVREFLNEQT